MFWRYLLNRIFSFLAQQPARQNMQDAGDGNFQIGKVQGNVIHQGQLPEINIHIHGGAVTTAVASESAEVPPVAVRDTAAVVSRPVDMVQAMPQAANAERMIDPPDVIALRREVFDWLNRFDQLPVKRTIVYEFMQDKFKTTEVMALDKLQLFRVSRWCEVVYESKRPTSSRRTSKNYGVPRTIRK